MNLINKSVKTCVSMLRKGGYQVNYYEPNTMEASLNAAGVCVRWMKLHFSPAGRCFKVEEYTC